MSPVHNFDPGAAKKARYRPKIDKMAELWLLVIFGPFWPLGQNLGHTPHRHTPNSAKTSARMSCNLFHAVPTVLDHQSAQARALKPTSVIGHKRAILGNRGQKTARRAAERAPTGKPKVSRVTSGYEEDMNPLSRVCIRPKKGVMWV